MPRGKAYEGGGRLIRAMLAPSEAEAGLDHQQRRLACAAWIADQLDSLRKPSAPPLTSEERERLSLKFFDAVDFFIAEERGAIKVTPTELSRRIGGNDIISAAKRAIAAELTSSQLNRLLDGHLSDPKEKAQLPFLEALDRHNLLISRLRARLTRGGWTEPFTLGQLARRLSIDPVVASDPDVFDLVKRLSELEPGPKGYTAVLKGGMAFQVLVSQTAPVWTRWTGRSALMNSELFGKEQRSQYPKTLYALLRKAVTDLQRDQADRYTWDEKPEAFQDIVRRLNQPEK